MIQVCDGVFAREKRIDIVMLRMEVADGNPKVRIKSDLSMLNNCKARRSCWYHVAKR
jgi:hypothetical protein